MKRAILCSVILCATFQLNANSVISEVEGYVQNAQACASLFAFLPRIWELSQQGAALTPDQQIVLAYLKAQVAQSQCPLNSKLLEALTLIEKAEMLEAKAAQGVAKVEQVAAQVKADAAVLAAKAQAEEAVVASKLSAAFAKFNG